MHLPGISVVIVSYNEEKNMADCLNSLQALDYPEEKLEILVVDSSSDKTPDIVRSYQKVRLLLSNCRDFPVVRNMGLRSASHELVAFLDADCIATPDWLNRLVPKITLPDVAAVGCNAYPPPDSPFLGKCFACLGKPAGGAIGFDSEVEFLTRGVNWIGSCCSLYRKSWALKVGGFDESLQYGKEDVNLCERFLQAGYVIEYEPDVFVYHKTRNTFRQFIPWAFRRGKSQFHATKSTLIQILLEPFSVLWLFIVLIAFVVTPSRNLVPLALLALLLMLVVSIGLFRGSLHRHFPSGCKKFKLLVERRRRIGVNAGIIFFFIIPLFYLDRMIINLALLYSKVKIHGSPGKSAI
ncbi:MAG: glycosyltransferase [Oryzomonas sp.]|uniref:glycosyltransferase n=1 Tax=Oryzomonas sp. TaxID=2855186 RepID=UPI00283C706B|nr:glycosyltransferase [Oryzomonas sp.]MDR3579654.1 glycosyltransferase [Oryzomonas sp.]